MTTDRYLLNENVQCDEGLTTMRVKPVGVITNSELMHMCTQEHALARAFYP